MRACWLLIAVAGCTTRTPPAVVSNHAPSWREHCAPVLEGSVHADASGVDRLVARVDDDLRACWKLAVRIVDAGHPVAPPPSCRALRVSELHLSAAWLASCRRFEAGAPPGPPSVARAPLVERPSFASARLLRQPFVDLDHDGVPDPIDPCVDAGDGVVCPRAERPPLPRLRGLPLQALPSQAPAMPPYDLTPAAQSVCAAVHEVVAQWASAPNPTIPLALVQRWTAGRYEVEWPTQSTIAPVEDALRACLAEWTLETTTTGDARSLRWQKARFSIELHTSPERRLVIERP